jgi:hypothetical protein
MEAWSRVRRVRMFLGVIETGNEYRIISDDLEEAEKRSFIQVLHVRRSKSGSLSVIFDLSVSRNSR